MATRIIEKNIARLKELHPDLTEYYLNPDGRKVAIYRVRGRRNRKTGKITRPDLRYTVYAKNWNVIHASTEGYRNRKALLSNASQPAPIPPVPELGNGVHGRV